VLGFQGETRNTSSHPRDICTIEYKASEADMGEESDPQARDLLLLICGLPAAGKSTFSRALFAALQERKVFFTYVFVSLNHH
jgi:hypothetical protein